MQIVEAIHERIAQSEVRLRSAIRLIALFAALAGIAYFFKVIWLVRLSSCVAGFFSLVTLLQYWNVKRLKP